jgi:hypothetical protein
MIGDILCSMGVFEHLGAWQAHLLSIPVGQFSFVLFVLTLVLIIIRVSSSPPLLRQFLYYKKTRFVTIFSNLTEQFSQGILNPKPY